MYKITNAARFAQDLQEYWSPKIIDALDNHYVKVAKLKGSLTWHAHQEQDELFVVLNGTLQMQYRDRTILLNQGDLHVVPKGIEHNPIAEHECTVLLIERKDTLHTGDVIVQGSKTIEQQH